MVPVFLLYFFWTVTFQGFVCASPRHQEGLLGKPVLSRARACDNASHVDWIELARRQETTFENTCGFLTGDPTKPRTADGRVDVENSLWGFCPSTVISASDCGLAGNCVDSHACSKGCGAVGNTKITTFTCGNTGDFCSTALLTARPDQTYSYIACGKVATTDHLLAAFTTGDSPTSTPTPSSSFPTPRSTSSLPSSTLQTALSSSLGSSSSIATTSLATTTSSPTASSSTSSFLALPQNSQSSTTSTPVPTTNISAIVGGVIGGLALLCISIIVIFWLRCRSNNLIPSQSLATSLDTYGSQRELVSIERPASDYKFSGYSPVEMANKRSPAEIGTRWTVSELPATPIPAWHRVSVSKSLKGLGLGVQH
ncbi:uncharacterized protein BDZ99DRAFT_577436 [Mytilinidion resinicola]|uniref:Mid2 domain-containing protein n=1 Tax=Mytilinidion resinicola TaxID=574789 RepID=A0A6A6XZR5_9PEZI|nr:uncharacterized protein BDZ99DRAFT_577436 [Mytilinidion resinicola]KAF2801753.1 hypothetical protein BDZ99DRAFT_577436 [Mytilinidion resinicola]